MKLSANQQMKKRELQQRYGNDVAKLWEARTLLKKEIWVSLGRAAESPTWTAFGRKQTLQDWAREFGLEYGTLRHRILRRHCHIETALTTEFNRPPPGRPARKVSAFGRKQTLQDWAREFGLKYATLLTRIKKKGMTLEKALTWARPAAPMKPKTIKDCRVCGVPFITKRIADGRISRATTCSAMCRYANHDISKATAAAIKANTKGRR